MHVAIAVGIALRHDRWNPHGRGLTGETFGKLDVGKGCDGAGNVVSVVTKGQVSDFDPAEHIGETLPRVVGTLRPVNTSAGGFNVWILYPRSIDDLELP